MVTIVWIKSPRSIKGLVTRLWYWWKLRESLGVGFAGTRLISQGRTVIVGSL